MYVLVTYGTIAILLTSKYRHYKLDGVVLPYVLITNSRAVDLNVKSTAALSRLI